MREFQRIQRIIDLVTHLWAYDQILTLGSLLEKWIWTDWMALRGDIFYSEDTQTEQRLNEAIKRAEATSTASELSQVQRDILKNIAELWPHVPDQRFGQFLSNYAFGHFMSHPPKKMLQQNDEIILKNLQNYQSQ
ncbi:hypothetical protein I4U23_020355 [Adineta vaga]|nr:hypothetical protein I4U23_020355 [Adineta vaga]